MGEGIAAYSTAVVESNVDETYVRLHTDDGISSKRLGRPVESKEVSNVVVSHTLDEAAAISGEDICVCG